MRREKNNNKKKDSRIRSTLQCARHTITATIVNAHVEYILAFLCVSLKLSFVSAFSLQRPEDRLDVWTPLCYVVARQFSLLHGVQLLGESVQFNVQGVVTFHPRKHFDIQLRTRLGVVVRSGTFKFRPPKPCPQCFAPVTFIIFQEQYKRKIVQPSLRSFEVFGPPPLKNRTIKF